MIQTAMDARAGARTADWSTAAGEGLVSGAVFMMLETMMVPLFMGGIPWAPPLLIAAMGWEKPLALGLIAAWWYRARARSSRGAPSRA